MRRQEVVQHIFEVGPIFSFSYMIKEYVVEFFDLYEEKVRSRITMNDGHVDCVVFCL